jgi:hypothetical protein
MLGEAATLLETALTSPIDDSIPLIDGWLHRYRKFFETKWLVPAGTIQEKDLNNL